MNGQKLRALRLDNNLTLKDVADRIGVKHQTVFKYENEIITTIPTDKLVALANLYSVSPSYLLDLEDSKPVLSDVQKKILEATTLLNSEGQQKVLEFSNDLSGNAIYKKDVL